MSKRTGIGKAHGKIILIGEHSVVYNQPAIAIPFKEVKVTTTITDSDQLTVDCVYHKGLLSSAPSNLDNLKAVVIATLDRLNQTDNFHIQIDSLIPQERGMGSSAAVANATIAAIYDYFNVDLDEATQFELAQVSETIAHGNPSGLDAKVTVSQKPLYFIKNAVLEPFDINCHGYLVVADTGEKGQTLKAVSALGQKRQQAPQEVEELLTHQGKLSNYVKEALNADDMVTLGSYLDLAQTNLAKMGVSNHALNRLIETAKRHGALGSKLTGGGWGGCMFALVSNLSSAQKLQQALLDNQASQTWLLAL